MKPVHSLTRAKLQRRFDLFDKDGDGQVNKEDYDHLAARLAEAAGSGPDSEPARRLRREYDEGWLRMCKQLGCGADASMDREEFVGAWHGVQEAYGFTASILPIVDTVIAAMDRDGDGALDAQEFTRWLEAYGVGSGSALEAFERLDRDGDGRISREELAQAFEEFFLSTDASAPGNWLYGPLAHTTAAAG
ncbi:EF-hand domain-containing protein [Streptomyces sp. NPDC003042]